MIARKLALAAALTAWLLALPIAANPLAAIEYEKGLAAYDECHWVEAAVHFERAASAGHVRSQEILGMMLVTGPLLYRDGIPRDPATAWAWFDRASASGSELGTLMAKRTAMTKDRRAGIAQ